MHVISIYNQSMQLSETHLKMSLTSKTQFSILLESIFIDKMIKYIIWLLIYLKLGLAT